MPTEWLSDLLIAISKGPVRMPNLTSLYIDVRALRPGTIGAYTFAFLCAAVATALAVALDPYVVGVPFVTFSPAVVVTTLISGLGAGLFCVVLGVASATFFLLPPRWSFYVESSTDVVEISVFIVEAFFYVILITGLRLTLERYRELSRDLEQRVEDRSAALRESQDRLVSVVAELQHRTRNLISVVGTIAKGTLRTSKTFDDFSATFQNRLEVLGRAQGLLFRAEAAGLPSTNWSIPSWQRSPFLWGNMDPLRSTDRKAFLCALAQFSPSRWPYTN
jgi:Domain of unknown function (DUF4118)/HWE histidine kinase